MAAGILSGCARAARTVTIVLHEAARQVGPNRVDIELDRSFVEQYRDRVTIRAMFTVDAVSRRINPEPFDGDLHIAGRAPEIGLRLVSEIKNAKSVARAVAMVRGAEGTGKPLELIGGWRLWPEHAIGLPHRQGRPVKPLENANPDHVFEVHPIISVEGTSLMETLRPVSNYRPYSAPRTLASYERAVMTIRLTPKTVRLRTPAGLFNDVHFMMELGDGEPVLLTDGRVLFGRALDLEGRVLVERVRLVFFEDSPPELAVRSKPTGTRLHVWALPRISFAELSRLVDSISDTLTHTVKLPYELVIVGVYP